MTPHHIHSGEMRRTTSFGDERNRTLSPGVDSRKNARFDGAWANGQKWPKSLDFFGSLSGSLTADLPYHPLVSPQTPQILMSETFSPLHMVSVKSESVNKILGVETTFILDFVLCDAT